MNQIEKMLYSQQEHTRGLIEALRHERVQEQEQLKLLKFGEVRQILNVSRATLWRMVKRGQVRVTEIVPGIKRVSLAEIRRLTNGKAVPNE
ncbi:MAG: hypothetical protein LBF26_00570 [Puniceicoccales bacterium]|jgi:predicted DNA-binding protein (UPF0251 family)|nr:hypothetical protein [Puniceicoccales bacterium]